MDDSIKVNMAGNHELKALNVHSGFVFKVYGIVTFQILITFLIGLLPVLSDSIAENMIRFAIPIAIVTIIVLLISLFQLVWYADLYKRVPMNYLLLLVITVCLAMNVALACATAEKYAVLVAIIATMTSVCSLTVFAFFTKDNIAFFQGMLVISANCLITILICIFFVEMKVGRVLIACVGVVIFGMYLLYDTKMLMTNTVIDISCDDYILAAIVLYFDIIMMFLKILELLKVFK